MFFVFTGRVDVDGKEIGPATPRVGGYNFVSTPTPNPDSAGAESPMMTWGEIEGTPFLLDASDKPVKPVTPGPVFKVPSFHESQRHVCAPPCLLTKRNVLY